jgi:hypothetical protein
MWAEYHILIFKADGYTQPVGIKKLTRHYSHANLRVTDILTRFGARQCHPQVAPS